MLQYNYGDSFWEGAFCPICKIYCVCVGGLSSSRKKSDGDSVRGKDFTSGKHVREMYTPLDPYFIWQKSWVAGVYLIFIFLIQNIHCGYSARRL